jgi:hypothetical protein
MSSEKDKEEQKGQVDTCIRKMKEERRVLINKKQYRY